MNKIIIAAVSENGVIGLDNKIPWHFSSDMKRFKKLTTGHAIVMGRKTFDSLGKALPNRCNIVLSRRHPSTTKLNKDATPNFVDGLDSAFKLASEFESCFVIGGEDIYRLALPHVDTLMITYIPRTYYGDTFFPEWPLGDDWYWSRLTFPKDRDIAFHTYRRKPLK